MVTCGNLCGNLLYSLICAHIYEANGDSRVYYTVNFKKKVRVGLVLYSTSLTTFHDQSYSLVHGFNSPINFRNTEVQHCFLHPC